MSITTQSIEPVAKLRQQLVAMGSEFRNALPSHIKPEKFQRVVMTVVQQTPELLAADRHSLLAACTKCAADGLVPDGREAALVIFNTKTKDGGWEKRVQYMPMLAGLQKRARNTGEISGIEAHVIYEHDDFTWRQGTESELRHIPKFPGPRGGPIGAYAIARFKDGSQPQVEVMDVDEINRVRAISRAKDSGPWVSWWSEMARKTVFRRLSKWLPADAEVDDLIRRDDENEADMPGVVLEGDHAPAPAQITVSKLDALEGEVVEEKAVGYASPDLDEATPLAETQEQKIKARCEALKMAIANAQDQDELNQVHERLSTAIAWFRERKMTDYAEELEDCYSRRLQALRGEEAAI